MILGHGGSAGLLVEIAVVAVPAAILVFFVRWARRHGATEEEEDRPVE